MLVSISRAVFGYGRRPVVRVERLDLHAGHCLGIFGPNGTGKTTLVRGLTGLLPPIEGAVSRSVADLRVGYLPQHRAMELQWPMTGFDAAALATSARRMFGWVGGPSGAAGRAILESMRRFGVEDLSRRPFARLSGGQQQRLLLAGAMVANPAMLVLDEPTDGLDVHARANLIALLREAITGGLCTVMISHEVQDLIELCDEIAWLHPAAASGEPSEVERTDPSELARRMLLTRRAP